MFVLVHGSWHNGDAWHKVQQRLEDAGEAVLAPTLSGMESIHDPGSAHIGLNTHIDDIVDLVCDEDLAGVTLVAHSYSGFVIEGAADRLGDRIEHLVFLDAFVPDSGESLFDLLGPESEAGMRAGLVDATGKTVADGASEVWLLPPAEAEFYLGEDATDEDIAWLSERLVYKPVRTFSEKLHLADQGRVRAIPSTFIRCTGFPYMDGPRSKAEALGWPILEIATGHDAMITAPDQVTELLLDTTRNANLEEEQG